MQLITTAQELTDAWENLGGVIDMRSFNGLSLFFGLDINDSENLQFRAIYKRSLNDQDNYEATIGELTSGDMVLSPKVYELGVDADGNYSLKITTNNTAPYLQLQVQVLTEGATAGEILTADYFTSHFIDVNASEGGGGGGGSSLALETDGTPNGDQTLLNLAEGANITLTDNGTGTVTIAAAGGGGGGGENLIALKNFWPSNTSTGTDASYILEIGSAGTNTGNINTQLWGYRLDSSESDYWGLSTGGAAISPWDDYSHEMTGQVNLKPASSGVDKQLWGFTSDNSGSFLSGSNISFGPIPDSAFFYVVYDADGYYLKAVTIDEAGNVEMTTIQGVPDSVNNYMQLKIILTISSVQFWVNGVLEATHTTQIPTGVVVPIRWMSAALTNGSGAASTNAEIQIGPMTHRVILPA